MLLHVQNPGIRYALRAPVWEQQFGRRLKPGARPYVILRTMGPVAFVFDVSDTEPHDLFAPPLHALLENPFPARGQPPPLALPNIIAACLSIRIVVEERDYAMALAGKVEVVVGRTYDFHVFLNSKHTAAQKLGTLAHELAHVFCGHFGKTKSGFWPDRANITNHTVREFEAEAVAYFVTERMSLDIGSVAYLASYLDKDKPLPNYSLEAVLKSAGKVEEMAAGKFHPRKNKNELRSQAINYAQDL